MLVLGAAEHLVTDGESAMVTAKNRSRFEATNTILQVRAPGQHTNFAERHGAMLRFCINVLVAVLKDKGIE